MSPRQFDQPSQLAVLAAQGDQQIHNERGLRGDGAAQPITGGESGRPPQFVGRWYLKTRDAATRYGYRSRNGFRDWALRVLGVVPVLRGAALLWDVRDIDQAIERLRVGHKATLRRSA